MSFRSSSSESELSAFKTVLVYQAFKKDNTFKDYNSTPSSLGETRSSLAPLAKSASLEDVFKLFEEDGQGELVINGHYEGSIMQMIALMIIAFF